MKPTISEMITAASAGLGSLLALGAEGFAKQAGTSAFEATKKLLTKLHDKWAGDAEAGSQLARFEADPLANREGFERVLADHLAQEDELRAEVAAWLDLMGPQLHVVQRISFAEKATGVAADQMTEGRVKVEMDVEQGKDITGVNIKRIGR